MHLVRLNRGGQFYDWICPSGAASMPRPGPVTNPAAIENSRCGPGDSLYPIKKKSPEAVRSGLSHEPNSPKQSNDVIPSSGCNVRANAIRAITGVSRIVSVNPGSGGRGTGVEMRCLS